MSTLTPGMRWALSFVYDTGARGTQAFLPPMRPAQQQSMRALLRRGLIRESMTDAHRYVITNKGVRALKAVPQVKE